eukprot:CAMPEP_0197058758 /NCGR_PEP_ID=MMETSP1384-20130603/111001_1 /TAXON_ID=29189 /ORGANISM="Ammonia sp." /LENGTH=47 /DNA_ID= /DNA_START= /DNA_END= /DNA_ORIENTATION=
MTWEETSDDTFHESDAKAKNSASIWISNWLRKQQEEEKRRQEEERKR